MNADTFNWEMISALGEILGAAAVVVSLVYLARQVTLSNRLARAEAWRSRFSEFANINSAFGVDPRFHNAMVKIHQGCTKGALEQDEAALANSFIISVSQIFEQLIQEVRGGVLDPKALDEFTGESLFHLPYFREQWPMFRQIFSRPLAQFLANRYGLSEPSENSANHAAGTGKR